MLRSAVFALLLLTSIARAAELTTAPVVTLTGRITTPDNSPAEGAVITLRQTSWTLRDDQPFTTAAQAIADKQGRYSADVVLNQYTLMEVEHPNFAKMQTTLDGYMDSYETALPPLRPYTLTKDVQLQRCGMLQGHVTDEQGSPVAGASLSVSTIPPFSSPWPSEQITTSSKDGTVRFSKAPVGDVRVSVRAPGFVPRATNITSPGADVKLQLSSVGGTIRGRVMDAQTSQPAAGARVSLRQWSDGKTDVFYWRPIQTTANAAGEYEFGHLPPGKFLLDARFGGRGAVPIAEESDRLPKIDAGSQIVQHDLPLYVGHTISGLVTDRATSTPLPGAEVRIGRDYMFDEVRSTTTDANGRYSFAHVFAPMRKNVGVQVICPGYRMALDRADATYGSIEIAGRPTQIEETLEMVPTRVVHGRVEQPDGRPAPGAWVGIKNDRHSWAGQQRVVRADTNGSFRFEAPTNSECVLVYEAEGFPRCSTKLEAGTASPSTITLQLNTGREVCGQVVDAANKPVDGAQVTLLSEYCPLVRTHTDSQGRFAFPQVTTGTLVPQVTSGPKYDDGPSIAWGSENQDILIRLAKRSHIAGTVKTANGDPVKGAQVSANGLHTRVRSGSYGSATSGADGRFIINNLYEDDHTVRISSPGWCSKEITTMAGVANVDLRVTSAPAVQLIERVVDLLTNEPVRDFTVTHNYGPGKLKQDASSGTFTVDGLPAGGSVSLTVGSPGREALSKDFYAPDDGTTMVEELTKLGATGTVEGVVSYDDADRTPAARVAVKIFDAQLNGSFDARRDAPGNVVYTDANGRFRKEKLPAAEYTIALMNSAAGSVQSASAFVLPRMVVQAPELLLKRPRKLTGQMLRLVPVPGVKLTLQNSGDGATTDVVSGPDGSFEFPAFPSEADAQSLITMHTANGEPQQLDVGASGTPQFTWLDENCAFAGVVTRGGAPVIQAEVQLSREPMFFQRSAAYLESQVSNRLIAGPVCTASDGSFRLDGLVPGRWTATIMGFEDEPLSKSIKSDADIFPDSNGQTLVSPLTPLREQQTTPHRSPAWTFRRRISIGASEVTTASIDIPAGALRGTTVDESGGAIAGVQVSIRVSTGQAICGTRDASTISGADGRWTINGLENARYSVQAIGADARHFGSADAQASATPADVQVKLVHCQAPLPQIRVLGQQPANSE